MSTITVTELNHLLSQNPSLPVIDVRTPVEFAEAHVPQAANIPLDTLAPASLVESGTLPTDQPVYLLCRSGQRAGKAAEQFAKEGYRNAVVVEGGTLAWIEAKLPVKRSEVRTISLERQVRIAAGTLVVLGVLLSLLLHPAFVALAGFVGAGLVFAGITDWCGMGLLLAKAPWNRR